MGDAQSHRAFGGKLSRMAVEEVEKKTAQEARRTLGPHGRRRIAKGGYEKGKLAIKLALRERPEPHDKIPALFYCPVGFRENQNAGSLVAEKAPRRKLGFREDLRLLKNPVMSFSDLCSEAENPVL